MFYVSSGILSVLQTPPVMRRSLGLLRDAAASASVTKPQSILSAVRHKTSSTRLTWDGVYTACCCRRQLIRYFCSVAVSISLKVFESILECSRTWKVFESDLVLEKKPFLLLMILDIGEHMKEHVKQCRHNNVSLKQPV